MFRGAREAFQIAYGDIVVFCKGTYSLRYDNKYNKYCKNPFSRPVAYINDAPTSLTLLRVYYTTTRNVSFGVSTIHHPILYNYMTFCSKNKIILYTGSPGCDQIYNFRSF